MRIKRLEAAAASDAARWYGRHTVADLQREFSFWAELAWLERCQALLAGLQVTGSQGEIIRGVLACIMYNTY